jgi:hypothetical protein
MKTYHPNFLCQVGSMKYLIAVIEITAAFFLAVEAIKLENLRSLQGHILLFALALVPFEIVPARFIAIRRKPYWWLLLFIACCIGTLTVAILLSLTFGLDVVHFPSRGLALLPTGGYLRLPFLIALALLSIGIMILMGLLTYLFLLIVGLGIFVFGDWIESSTPNGVVGIFGFLLFVVATVLKLFEY